MTRNSLKRMLLSKRFATLLVCVNFIVPTTMLQAAEPLNANKMRKLSHPQKGHSKQQIWNLRDVDIKTLAREVSKITKKNFIFGPKARAKVTFIANKALGSQELYEAFLSILRAHDLIAIPDGKVIRIVREQKASDLEAPYVKRYKLAAHQSSLVTTVVNIRRGSVNDVYNAVKPLMSSSKESLAMHQPSNDLIITSPANKLTSLLRLIRDIDRPISPIASIKIRYNDAQNLVDAIQKIMPKGEKSQAIGVRLSADEQSNNIIVSGGTLSQRMQIRSLIKQLDTRRQRNRKQISVIRLKEQEAETIAPIINAIIQNYYLEKGQTGTLTSVAKSKTDRGPSAAFKSFNLQNPLENVASTNVQNSSRMQKGDFSGLKQDKTASGIESQYVQWDQATNSLIVTAPGELMAKVRRVIARLDTPRPQVLIQAIIANVDLEHSRELGVEWTLGGNPIAATRFGRSLPLALITDNATSTTDTNTGNTIGRGLSVGVFSGDNLRALLRALATDTSTNILSTPNLMTLDNQPAEIRVGRTVSFAIGTIENNPTGGNPFTSFEREHIGLNLRIRPLITRDGRIRLVIQQELSNLIPNTGAINGRPGDNPDTTDRYIQTTVTAHDGQILVLGGLIQNETTDVNEHVPILGNIPLIGALFRDHQRISKKTDLMIFLRPVVINYGGQAKQVTAAKYARMRGLQNKLNQRYSRFYQRGLPEPVLPPPGSVRLPKPFAS